RACRLREDADVFGLGRQRATLLQVHSSWSAPTLAAQDDLAGSLRGVGVEPKRCPLPIRLASSGSGDSENAIVIGDSTWKEVLDSLAPEYDEWVGVDTDEGKEARAKIYNAVMESLGSRKIFSKKIDGTLVELNPAQIRNRVAKHLWKRSSVYKEYNKAYHCENRDAISAQKKRYYQENRDARLAYWSRYYRENSEQILAKLRDKTRYESSRRSKATADALRSRQREYRSSDGEPLHATRLLFPELEHVQCAARPEVGGRAAEEDGKLVIDFITPYPDDLEDKPTLNDSDALTKYGITSGSEFIYPLRVHVSQVHPKDLQRTEGDALLLPNKRIDEETKIKAGIEGMWRGSKRSDHDRVFTGVDVMEGIKFHFRKHRQVFKWRAGGKVYAYLIFSTNDLYGSFSQLRLKSGWIDRNQALMSYSLLPTAPCACLEIELGEDEEKLTDTKYTFIRIDGDMDKEVRMSLDDPGLIVTTYGITTS
ncbi:hypothetical protein THAOC_13806, partial [Thalassiosira oceanica]